MDHASVEHVLDVLKANSSLIAMSAGPLALTILARIFFGGNKLMMYAIRGSAAWLAIRVILGPFMQLAKDNVGYLMQITSR